MSDWTTERIGRERDDLRAGWRTLWTPEEALSALDEIERLRARVAELARLLHVASAFEERLCARDQRRERLLRRCESLLAGDVDAMAHIGLNEKHKARLLTDIRAELDPPADAGAKNNG